MINHPNRAKTPAFETFWKAVNLAFKDRGLPELTFGEARTYWEMAKE